MAEVYEAEHMRFAARFAVKVLLDDVVKDEEVLKRFQREAEIASALRHPNIVHVVDFNRLPDGAPYMVMEFLDGVDLGTQIERQGPMSLDKTLDIIGQVASALTAAHSQKIVHRDVKPQNLFLVRLADDEQAVVKMLDFGISKVKEATTRLTRQACIMGTPQYMAPEQALGLNEQIDERTDEFALAAITYELITGRSPFLGETTHVVLYQVVHESPPPFPRPMPTVEKVVLRGMAKEQDARYPTVRDYYKALVEAVRIERQHPLASVPHTMAIAGTPSDVEGAPSQGSTEILPVKTVFEGAPKVFTAGNGEEKHAARRWSRPILGASVLFLVVSVAAVSWSRLKREQQKADAGRESTLPEPVASSTSTILLDAAVAPAPDTAPKLALPIERTESTVKPTSTAKTEAKAMGARRKRMPIRMEDL